MKCIPVAPDREQFLTIASLPEIIAEIWTALAYFFLNYKIKCGERVYFGTNYHGYDGFMMIQLSIMPWNNVYDVNNLTNQASSPRIMPGGKLWSCPCHHCSAMTKFLNSGEQTRIRMPANSDLGHASMTVRQSRQCMKSIHKAIKKHPSGQLEQSSRTTSCQH